jgi:hypothetical protein
VSVPPVYEGFFDRACISYNFYWVPLGVTDPYAFEVRVLYPVIEVSFFERCLFHGFLDWGVSASDLSRFCYESTFYKLKKEGATFHKVTPSLSHWLTPAIYK